MEPEGGFVRIYSMGSLTYVSHADRRALRKGFILAGRVPKDVLLTPGRLLRAVRSSLAMSQLELSRRSGIRRAHICQLEAEVGNNVEWRTLRRLMAAMFCDIVLLARRRVNPRDIMPDGEVGKPYSRVDWTQAPRAAGAELGEPAAIGSRRPRRLPKGRVRPHYLDDLLE